MQKLVSVPDCNPGFFGNVGSNPTRSTKFKSFCVIMEITQINFSMLLVKPINAFSGCATEET